MLGKIKEFFLRREITKLVQDHGWIRGPIVWLNAAPGRKRGAAALILGCGAALRYLGQTEWASRAEDVAQVVQFLSPATDVVGLIMAILGFGDAARRAKQVREGESTMDPTVGPRT